MITIGKLAKAVGISRSTLLYYDSLGLLCPKGRSAAGYRLYSKQDRTRLEQIRTYRCAGIPLEEIKNILDAESDKLTVVLENRLRATNDEIAALRDQQRVVVRLLRNRKHFNQTRAIDKKGWVELLKASGMTEDDMDRWHTEFERMSPQGHQDFLESLGIPLEEVAAIRAWSHKNHS